MSGMTIPMVTVATYTLVRSDMTFNVTRILIDIDMLNQALF